MTVLAQNMPHVCSPCTFELSHDTTLLLYSCVVRSGSDSLTSALACLRDVGGLCAGARLQQIFVGPSAKSSSRGLCREATHKRLVLLYFYSTVPPQADTALRNLPLCTFWRYRANTRIPPYGLPKPLPLAHEPVGVLTVGSGGQANVTFGVRLKLFVRLRLGCRHRRSTCSYLSSRILHIIQIPRK